MKIKIDTGLLTRKDLARLLLLTVRHNRHQGNVIALNNQNYEALMEAYRGNKSQLDGVLTANATYRKELAEAQALILGEEAHAAIIEKQEQAVQKLVSENISLTEQNNEFVTSNEQLLAEVHRLRTQLRESEAKLTLITLGATQ